MCAYELVIFIPFFTSCVAARQPSAKCTPARHPIAHTPFGNTPCAPRADPTWCVGDARVLKPPSAVI
eukprot:2359634-Prymnesium_polylepis.1